MRTLAGENGVFENFGGPFKGIFQPFPRQIYAGGLDSIFATSRGSTGRRRGVPHEDVEGSCMRCCRRPARGRRALLHGVVDGGMFKTKTFMLALLDVYDIDWCGHLYIVRVSPRSSSVRRSRIPSSSVTRNCDPVLAFSRTYVT